MKRILSVLLSLLLLLSCIPLGAVSVAAAAEDGFFAITDDNCHLFLNVNQKVALSDIAVCIGGVETTGNLVNWTFDHDALCIVGDYLIVNEKGVFTAEVDTMDGNRYPVTIVTKYAGESEFVLYEDDFNSVADGTLPDGWSIFKNADVDESQRASIPTYMDQPQVQDGVLYIGNGATTKYTYVWLPAYLDSFGDYKVTADMAQTWVYNNVRAGGIVTRGDRTETTAAHPTHGYRIYIRRATTGGDGMRLTSLARIDNAANKTDAALPFPIGATRKWSRPDWTGAGAPDGTDPNPWYAPAESLDPDWKGEGYWVTWEITNADYAYTLDAYKTFEQPQFGGDMGPGNGGGWWETYHLKGDPSLEGYEMIVDTENWNPVDQRETGAVGLFTAGVQLAVNSIKVTVPTSILDVNPDDYEYVADTSPLHYIIEDGEVTITGCEQDAFGRVEIPSYLDGCPVVKIDENAFAYCYGFTELFIPSTVTEIHPWAFKDAYVLTTIDVDEHNEAYCSVDGVLYTKDMATLVSYPFEHGSEYAIPAGVQAIGTAAFYNNELITTLTIPASVTSIGDWNFNFAFRMSAVLYDGSPIDQENMTIGIENTYLEDAPWYYGTSVEGCVHQRLYLCDDTCQLCGEREDRSELHHWVHVPYKAPTCMELGNIEYWYCDVCGVASLQEEMMVNTNLKAVKLPSLDHVYDNDTDADCNVCGEYREIEGGEVVEPVAPDAVVHIDFEDGEQHFTSSDYVNVEDVNGNHYLIWDSTSRDWGNMYYYPGLDTNTEYKLTFKAKANKAASLWFKIMDNWATETVQETVELTTTWETYELYFNPGDFRMDVWLFQSPNLASNAAVYYLDDIVVTKVGAEPEEPSFDEYLTNGDFETGDFTGWNYNANYASISTDAQSGRYAMQMTDPAQWSEVASQIVSVEPDTEYAIVWYSKRVSGRGAFNLFLIDASGFSNLRSVRGQNWMNETSGDWVRNEYVVNTGDATEMYLKWSSETSNAGTILIDDITVTKVSADQPVDPDNGLVNGDFETGDETGWNVWQETAVSSDAAYNGNYGICLQGAGSWATMVNQTVAVEIGKTYTLSFYAKVNSIGVIALIGDGNNYLMNQWLGASAYADWTLFEYEFTATTDSIVVSFCGAGSGALENAYVDDITLAPVDDEPEICDHEYDHLADDTCNLCGEVRTLQTLTCGSSAAVTIANSYDIANFLFTPEWSGYYSFYSDNSDTDAYGYVYSVDGSCLASDDDNGGNGNFRIYIYLEAGVTYVLRAGCYSDRYGNYTVYIDCDHDYDTACDPDCNICGAVRESYHQYDHGCDPDCNYCGAYREPMEHWYEDACDEYCNECGEYRVTEHVFESVCDEYCLECGAWREAAHAYDHPCDPDCNVCGLVRNWFHEYDNALDTDCNKCGAVRECTYIVLNASAIVELTVARATQSFLFTPEVSGSYTFYSSSSTDTYGYLYDVNGVFLASDDDGGSGNNFYLTYYMEAGTTYEWRAGFFGDRTGTYTVSLVCGHYYDYDCDPNCNTCGEIRETEHYYDNDCDADCYYCGAIREVGDHYYVSDCDARCNICDMWRETEAEHTYDGGCDEYCDACDEWREAVHTYTNDCDNECDLCGYWRDAGHSYDNAADSDCNVCGEERELRYVTLDTPFTVTVNHSRETMNFLFTPTHSGEYIFRSEDVGDPYGYLYDLYGNQLARDDDGGPGNRDFYIAYYMEAGVTYELRGGYYSSNTGTYTAYITTAHQYDDDCDAECNICGAIRDPLHYFDTVCDATCGNCGAIRDAEPHAYEYPCSTNCVVCGEWREAEPHVYDSDCDPYCNYCDEWRETEAEHGYTNACDTYCDACGEWREAYHEYDNACDAYCNVCGEWRQADSHYYDNALDTDCNACGAVRVLNYIALNTPTTATVTVSRGTMSFLFTPTHSGEYVFYSSCNGDPYGYIYDLYGNQLARDDDSGNNLEFRIVYYMEAGVTYELRAGYYSSGTGTYTVYLTRNHEYDNVCDPDCNICGAVRDTYHVYDNACDTDCNYCGAIREVAGHVYHSDCDAYCNVCGAPRAEAIAPHAYDNACDAYCNACGAHRSVADHWYDNNCDAYCNECGAQRTALHVYDNACDQYCNVCEAYRVASAHVFDGAYALHCDICGEERTLQYLMLDTDTDVTVTRPYGTECFLFTPEESGDYIFYSNCNGDPYGYIYDAYGNLLVRDDDSGAGLEFRIVYYLEAGVTYELRGGYWSNYTGTYTMRLEHYNEVEHPEEPDVPVEPSFDGFITNGDFETGDTTGWDAYQYTSVVSDAALNGKFGLHLLGDGGWAQLLNQYFSVEPGKTYTMSMWVKALSNGVNLQVRDGGDGGDRLAGQWVNQTEWTYVEFTFTPTTDTICFYVCGSGLTTADSAYLDDVRVVLGATEECAHMYDNACDETCNLCGEWREVAGHAYDDPCDVYCNECGAQRATLHVYDNACDEHCNYCGAWRSVPGHVYDGDHDPDCNECGTLREVEIPGDVDGNGKVNMVDLARLQRYVVGWNTEIQWTASDVNNDGKVNIRDVGLLQQYLNGWDVRLG